MASSVRAAIKEVPTIVFKFILRPRPLGAQHRELAPEAQLLKFDEQREARREQEVATLAGTGDGLGAGRRHP